MHIASKYLTGEPATWGEGDWDGAPGGSPGNPPAGDGLFNQFDIIAALGAGTYLTGPYAALAPGASKDDEQTLLVYNKSTGELSVDASARIELTSIFVTSAGNLFIGDKPAVLDFTRTSEPNGSGVCADGTAPFQAKNTPAIDRLKPIVFVWGVPAP